mmetsp:Transcript_31785/g.46876  ORF Transcript_31785/g.46876 Transcript_31785/m.46876 type:complete len:121 (-) Transcript_31785:176-538(-)
MKLTIFLSVFLVVSCPIIVAFSLSPNAYYVERFAFGHKLMKRLSNPTDDDGSTRQEEKNVLEPNKALDVDFMKDDEPSLEFDLNPIPVFSGTILAALSTFITAYFFYAGLSGNDPLFQQY